MLKKIFLSALLSVGCAYGFSNQADIIRQLGNVYQLKDDVTLDKDSLIHAVQLIKVDMQNRLGDEPRIQQSPTMKKSSKEDKEEQREIPKTTWFVSATMDIKDQEKFFKLLSYPPIYLEGGTYLSNYKLRSLENNNDREELDRLIKKWNELSFDSQKINFETQKNLLLKNYQDEVVEEKQKKSGKNLTHQEKNHLKNQAKESFERIWKKNVAQNMFNFFVEKNSQFDNYLKDNYGLQDDGSQDSESEHKNLIDTFTLEDDLPEEPVETKMTEEESNFLHVHGMSKKDADTFFLKYLNVEVNISVRTLEDFKKSTIFSDDLRSEFDRLVTKWKSLRVDDQKRSLYRLYYYNFIQLTDVEEEVIKVQFNGLSSAAGIKRKNQFKQEKNEDWQKKIHHNLTFIVEEGRGDFYKWVIQKDHWWNKTYLYLE